MNLSLIRSMTRSAVFELENGLCFRPAHPFVVTLNGKTVYEACNTNVFSLFSLLPGTEYTVGVQAEGETLSLTFITEAETFFVDASRYGLVADGETDNTGKLQLPAEEESCYVVLVAESGCTLQYAEQTMLLNPGSALLLGPGGGCIQQTGSAAPELVGCSFPLSALHELRTQTQRDFSRLFEPEQSAVLYGSVQWNSRLRTLLELMRTAMEEPDYPGALYLLLVLHYIEQECIAESSAVARPHNKTVEHICAYLAANYRQKFSLSEVAARFYLSPYYLSRLFKRVTGQSIVDYINNRRIEAAQKLLETTELSISAVAEQTGFASAAHFRRVFHEVMGTGPLQYRKAHKK